jgi:uncharacterized RDD family membrane protein YckC
MEVDGVTSEGPPPGSDDATDETRVDIPVSAPPVGAPTPSQAIPPPGSPPPAAPPPSAPSPFLGAAAPWAPVPAANPYAVPGTVGIEIAGATPRVVAYIVDSVLLGILSGVLFGIVFRIVPDLGGAFLVQAVIGIVLEAAYFILFWTSDARATLGMRLLKLQVGNAFDGRKLDTGQAVRRWIALGGWLSALGYSQASAGFSGTALLLWSIVLLVTTAASPTKQGLHDRFANSAIVQPVGGSSSGLVLGCLLILGLLGLLFLSAILALVFLGGQVSTILSSVGTSVAP